jgi:hypothetical protein
MAGITIAQAEAALARWIAADEAVSNRQSYSIAGRTYTSSNAKEIRENIDYWDNKAKELTENAAGGLITSQMTIIDT